MFSVKMYILHTIYNTYFVFVVSEDEELHKSNFKNLHVSHVSKLGENAYPYLNQN